MMVKFGWLMEPLSVRGEWRCAGMKSGVRCVMTPGIQLMHKWSAVNWATMSPKKVSMYIATINNGYDATTNVALQPLYLYIILLSFFCF